MLKETAHTYVSINHLARCSHPPIDVPLELEQPTPEKIAFWAHRLESVARLRQEVSGSLGERGLTTPARPGPESSAGSGEEEWHTPAPASGWKARERAATRADRKLLIDEPEMLDEAGSPTNALIRAIRTCRSEDFIQEEMWQCDGEQEG